MAEAQNPEFAAIVNGSRDIDEAADQVVSGPKPAGAVSTEVLDPALAWAEIPQMVGQMLTMALPELKPVYTDKACLEWGKSMHRLAVKRGWSADGLPPEVSVALVSATIVIPTAIAIKMRRQVAKAQDAAKKAGETQQPTGAESVGQAV